MLMDYKALPHKHMNEVNKPLFGCVSTNYGVDLTASQSLTFDKHVACYSDFRWHISALHRSFETGDQMYDNLLRNFIVLLFTVPH